MGSVLRILNFLAHFSFSFFLLCFLPLALSCLLTFRRHLVDAGSRKFSSGLGDDLSLHFCNCVNRLECAFLGQPGGTCRVGGCRVAWLAIKQAKNSFPWRDVRFLPPIDPPPCYRHWPGFLLSISQVNRWRIYESLLYVPVDLDSPNFHWNNFISPRLVGFLLYVCILAELARCHV